MPTSGFSLTSLVEVDAGQALGGVLLQDRIGVRKPRRTQLASTFSLIAFG